MPASCTSGWPASAFRLRITRRTRFGARNGVTSVQAAEVRFGNGVFWGVQYHPELAIGEIATALRAQRAGLALLVETGLAEQEADVLARADDLDALHSIPTAAPCVGGWESTASSPTSASDAAR